MRCQSCTNRWWRCQGCNRSMWASRVSLAPVVCWCKACRGGRWHLLPCCVTQPECMTCTQNAICGVLAGPAEAAPNHEARHGFPNVLLGLTRLTCLGWGCTVSTAVFDFGALPEALGQGLTQLRGLGFVNCGVRALPASMTQLTKLRALGIIDDRMPRNFPPPQLPLSVPGLPASLCRVHVSSFTLPTALQQLSGLTYLGWDSPARRSDFLKLSTLVALQQLRVSNYKGGTNLAEAMNGLQLPPALHTLALVGCDLIRLPQLPAAGLQRLRHLNLASNRWTRFAVAPSSN